MARLVAHLMHDRDFTIPDGGEIVRDWLPIRDFAAGLLRAAPDDALLPEAPKPDSTRTDPKPG
jgi:hypothetical protein